MKRCVIFTLLSANNIGAFLQAYSLWYVIKSIWEPCEVLFGSFPSASTERSSRFSKILKYIKDGDFRKLNFKARSASSYNEIRSTLPVMEITPDTQFDIAIIGSDEVWNIKSSNFVHYPAYLGHHINADKIIAYAPCGNGVKVEDFRSIVPNEKFEKFSALSARDTLTQECVKRLSGREVARVVDPTMLIDDFGQKFPPCPIKNDFILVYSYGVGDKYIPEIKKFSKNENLPLMSVGTYNSWCDKNIVANPWEFLGYLKAAKYVIVSTFHGTILSIKFNKQFVCYSGNSFKVDDILSFYELENRNVKEPGDIHSLLPKMINFEKTNRIIKESRESSRDYLIKALSR